ncbi:MAG: hypothetical protein VB087_08720 [Candidatus Limiplasma sp.]|nr:hypothetical protein [Candidatus Limiplasma sp.]MEA5145453.1 hypothetical protein [Candidatus Limiplasma sp.]
MEIKRSYRFWRGVARRFSPRMQAQWEVPFTGEPSVFICNHAGAYGPIAMCAHFPMADDLRPWMNAQVLSARETPAYVRQDYWWAPESRLAPLYSATLPYIAAAILPPIVRTAPTVPVYHDARVIRTVRASLRFLKEGKHLVIFPEQPSGYKTHDTTLNSGFLQIAPAFARQTGKGIAFWPVYIDMAQRVFRISAPIRFEVDTPLKDQMDRLMGGLRRAIQPHMPLAAESNPDTPEALPAGEV